MSSTLPPPPTQDLQEARRLAFSTGRDVPIQLDLAPVKALANRLGTFPLELVTYAPDPVAQERSCFWNVREKVMRDGGAMMFGWTFHARMSRFGAYAYVIHHAVWIATDRRSVFDITPFTTDPRHHPMTHNRCVVVLPDPNASPFTPEGILAVLPTRFFALGAAPDPSLTRLLDDLEREAIADAAKELADARARLQAGT